MLCAHCRAENPADNTYCGKCGRALTADDPPRYPDRVALLRREIIVVAAGLILLLAAAFGAWFALFFQRAPEAVVRNFIEADRAGRLEQQAQYVSNRADARLILALAQEFRRMSGSSLFQDYRIVGSTRSGQTATVDVQLTLPRPSPASSPPPIAPPPSTNTTFPVTFSLLREDGAWKIDPTLTLASVGGTLLANGYQQIRPYLNNPWPSGAPVFPLPPTFLSPPATPPPASSPSPRGTI